MAQCIGSNDFANMILDDLGNFEKLGLQGRDFFLKYDQQKSIERFGHLGLDHDDDYLYLTYLGDSCRVERTSAKVDVRRPSEGGASGSNNDGGWEPLLDPSPVLTIYDMLCRFQDFAPDATHQGSQPGAYPSCLSGQYCSVSTLTPTGESPSPDVFSQEYADEFCGHADRLARACENIGGKPQPAIARADLTFTIPLFNWLDLMFQFWDGDDEFDAKIMFMWDRNVLGFLHFETLYYVMIYVMARLRSEFRSL